MKIVVDVFGGDNAPDEIVKGCALALNCFKGFDLVLVGKEKIIKEKLEELVCDKSRVEIVNAESVVTNDDSPTEAIKSKAKRAAQSFDYTANVYPLGRAPN